MSIIKILLFIWPFIKEMVLGEKSLKEAMKDNKQKVMLAFIIVASLGLNMVTLTRLWTLSAQYLELQKRYTFVDAKMTDATTALNKLRASQGLPPVKHDEPPLKEPDKSVTVSPTVPPKKPRSEKLAQPVVHDKNTAMRAKRLKESFDKIKKREETDGSV